MMAVNEAETWRKKNGKKRLERPPDSSKRGPRPWYTKHKKKKKVPLKEHERKGWGGDGGVFWRA